MPSLHQDLTRTTLAVLFITGLIAATLWVLLPFLPAIVWAITLVVSTWPLMLRVQHYAGNRRGLAVLVMTVALLLIVIVPLWLAIATVVANVDEIAELSRAALSLRMPPPPEWLAGLPLVGRSAAQAWRQLAAADVSDLAPRLAPYAGYMTRWLAGAVAIRWQLRAQGHAVDPRVRPHTLRVVRRFIAVTKGAELRFRPFFLRSAAAHGSCMNDRAVFPWRASPFGPSRTSRKRR